jgi:thiol-disulfide isomerase/thioredoxin
MAATVSLAVVFFCARPSMAQTSANPHRSLLASSSIHYAASIEMFDSTGKRLTGFKSNVWISGSRVNIDQLIVPSKPLVGLPDGLPPMLLVSDGQTLYEYFGPENTYYKFKAPALDDIFPDDPLSFYSYDQIDLLSNPDRELAPDLEKRGFTRTEKSGVADGQRVRLITWTRKGISPDAAGVTFVDRVTLDAQTNLPLRREYSQIVKGREQLHDRVNFSDWALDQAIPDSKFVWAAPAGSTEDPGSNLLPVGSKVPDFEVRDSNGKIIRLSSYQGKPVLIDFWATWCGPCQESMPVLQALSEQVKGQPLAILPVCVWDTRPAYLEWVKTNAEKYTFPTAFDGAGRDFAHAVTSGFGVNGIPTQYLVGADGRVVAHVDGSGVNEYRTLTSLVSLGVHLDLDYLKVLLTQLP